MIYRTYAAEFGRWAMRHFGVGEEAAQDAFQDAVVIAWDHARSGHLTELRAGLKTYLFGVGRHRLLKSRARQSREPRWSDVSPPAGGGEPGGPAPTPEQEAGLALAANVGMLDQLLGPPDTPCRRLLEGFYFERRSLAELAQWLGYKTEAVARKKKCLCLRALRQVVSRYGLTLDSFLTDPIDQSPSDFSGS